MPEQFRHFERPTTEKPGTLVSATIVSAVVGLVTGAAGFSLLQRFYPIAGITVITPPGVRTVSEPAAVGNILSLVTPSLATLYQGPLPDSAATYVQLVSDAQLVGSGVVVSSDGWLLFAPRKAVIPRLSFVSVAGKLHSVQETETDTLTGLVFVKIVATNLRPVTFVSFEGLQVGTPLVSVEATVANQPLLSSAIIAQVAMLPAIDAGALVEFSDSYGQRLNLDQGKPGQFYFSSARVRADGNRILYSFLDVARDIRDVVERDVPFYRGVRH